MKSNGYVVKEATTVLEYLKSSPPVQQQKQAPKSTDQRSDVPVRRYLFLGEGGSGIEDVRRRKRLLQRWYPHQQWQHQVRYLVIDNDHKHQDDFDPGEFIAWDEIPLGDFIRAKLANPSRFPGLDRFGDLEARLQDLQPIEVVSNGFRGNRGIGGMGYEYQAVMHGDQMVNELVTPAIDLYSTSSDSVLINNGWSSALEHSDLNATNQLIISQSFSPGGAKGSTSALSDVWLLRSKLQDLGIANFRIDCTIYLPEIFNASRQQQKRNQAHTEAWLRELKATYTRDLAPLSIGRHQVVRTPVYTLIKLMNGVDERGQRVYSQSDVYDIGAATALLSSFGPVADHFESLIPNIVDDLNWPYVGYSQNCQLLVVPVQELQTVFSYQLAEIVLEQYLLRQPNVAEANQMGKRRAREWLVRHQLTPQTLSRLFTGDQGLQLSIDIKPYQRLPLPQLQKAVTDYEKAKFTSWERAIEKIVDRQVDMVTKALVGELTTLLNEPDQGVRTATFFLDHNPEEDIQGLSAFLADLRSMLTKRQAQTQASLKQTREQLSARANIVQKLVSLVLPSHKKQRWLRLKQRELQLRVMELLLHAQVDLIEQLEQVVRQNSHQLISYIAQLEQAARLLAQQRVRYDAQRQQRPVYETNVLRIEEEQALFADRQKSVLQLATQRITWQRQISSYENQASTWVIQVLQDHKTPLYQEKLVDLAGLTPLLHFTRSLFADLDTLDIEQILTKQGREPVDLIESMKQNSTPLVGVNLVADHLQQAQKAPGLRREVVLGAPHGAQGFFGTVNNKVAGFQIVDTGGKQRHRIVLLSSIFNINPFALAQSGGYAQAYTELKDAGHALHIFEESEVTDETTSQQTKRRGRRKQEEEVR